ncbi:MAG: hypothetical protein PVH88_18545 [Ignavibacteria bacterium]|jgi:hypothetical protein
MNSKYKSINLILQSVLIKAAKLKEFCEIKYLDFDDNVITSSGIIIDLINFHKGEFLILNNGIKIKLDSILELNGEKFTEEYSGVHYQKMNYANFSSNN